jgi:hypothetical protein
MIKLKQLILESQQQVTVIAYDMDGCLTDFEKQFEKLLNIDEVWEAAITHKKAISNKKLADAGITRNQFIKRANQIRHEVLSTGGDKMEILRNRFLDEFKAYSPGWRMIGSGGEEFWSTMDWMPGGQALVKYVESIPLPKIVITAGVGKGAESGKMKWLETHGMSQYATKDKFNIVSSGAEKGEIAEPGMLLIDDKPNNIKVFKDKGGMGIIHTNTPSTIAQLKKYHV